MIKKNKKISSHKTYCKFTTNLQKYGGNLLKILFKKCPLFELLRSEKVIISKLYSVKVLTHGLKMMERVKVRL